MPFLADRRAFKHLPVVGRGGCWLRYVGQSFGGVVSELIGERDGWSRPRLFRQILTRQIWGSAQQLSIRNQSYCATLLLPKTWTGVNFRLCFYLKNKSCTYYECLSPCSCPLLQQQQQNWGRSWALGDPGFGTGLDGTSCSCWAEENAKFKSQTQNEWKQLYV